MDEHNLVKVYTAKIPENIEIVDVLPKDRNQEIMSTENEKVKAEKFYAWKLLEHAIFHCFGVSIEDLTFSRNQSGKWLCEKFCFSISHSHGVVAVAVSNKNVGVDIEKFEKPQKNIERILCLKEKEEYEKLLEDEKWKYLLTAFSKKESIYKKQGKGAFLPSKISTEEENVFVKNLKFSNSEYILCVCSEIMGEINIYNVSLK